MSCRFLLALLPSLLIGQNAFSQDTSRDLSFTSQGLVLSASLLLPEGEPDAAIVLVHGSGPGERERLAEIARALNEQNIAILYYDKRGSGQSQGDWTRSHLTDLAQDAATALQTLRREIDPEIPTGLWGISQGGWVLPVAAGMSDADFLIVVSGGALLPQEVERHNYLQKLTLAGFDVEPSSVEELLVAYFDYLAGRNDLSSLDGLLEQCAGQEWVAQLGLEAVIPSPADRHHWEWVASHNPAAAIGRLEMPVLVLLGAQDPLTPHPATARAWEDLLPGVPFQQVVVFADAGHGIRLGAHGGDFAADYIETQARWLRQIARISEARQD